MSNKSKHMTDQEFIELCYQKILRMSPDKEGKIHYTNALSSRHLTREDIVIQFLTCEELMMNRFEGDGLSTIHNHDFLKEPRFVRAYQRAVTMGGMTSRSPGESMSLSGRLMRRASSVAILSSAASIRVSSAPRSWTTWTGTR